MGNGPHVTGLPPGIDLDEVLASLAEDNVWAPEADVAALRDVVSDAADHGIDLKIIAIPYNPRYGGELRDLANDVGAADGGTVLVMSPNVVGTFSDSIDRFTLEGAQTEIVHRDPVEAASMFVDDVTSPGFPWTELTFALLFFVAATIVALRWWTRRGYDPAAIAPAAIDPALNGPAATDAGPIEPSRNA
ncbi:hypothetical protein IEU95_06710 [Hoyosella rhizosphaerae]|uniref:Uncharacterized protein n=1 Tax=Hoyosella rhizosphaerae TaxID=1755582 RepID=A0A916U3B1_9ACTN|nr:DUF6676 family protein [Hoyosella rhizosphaerae]MBN4926513.1 hypothetical protein [Hoyosella rhizosphaerae]GGC58692.1 hypothetical protein GCM10011410_08990 [Hoyosella rhizosphaerae]